MDDKKSNVISFQRRKTPVSQGEKLASFEEPKDQNHRINHASEACNKSGYFSRVPQCVFEMGLCTQEILVWLYFNRLEPWKHPRVDEIHKEVGIRKAAVLTCLGRLSELNMIVVEGEGKNRRFHIPHPAYWKHPIPQQQYAFKALDECVPDIGKGVFTGILTKRSRRNVPGGTKKNVPPGTKKRSGRNEKEPENVPGGTKLSQENLGAQGVEPPLKISSQDLTRFLNTGGTGQTDLPRGDSISFEELEGAMLSLYSPLTKPKVIVSLIRAMCRKKSRPEVLSVIEARRREQKELMRWQQTHFDSWLERLDTISEPAEPEGPRYVADDDGKPDIPPDDIAF